MSFQKGYKVLLDLLGTGDEVGICALILTLPRPFELADCIDPLGRSILLPGLSGLGQGQFADEARQYICEQLAAGVCPELVHPITFGQKASEAFPLVMQGPQDEFMLHGGRGSGKTIVKYALALAIAEHHYRAGYTTVYRFMDLHDSLISADKKTSRSLELPLWRGIFTLHDDRREARCTLAGREFMRVDFVGCADDSSAQRLRSSTNGMGGEELIASLTDGCGITEEQYLLARSSMLREQTWRRIAISSTNPGGPDTWPARRFGIQGPGEPNALAIQIPCDDRMTPEEQTALRQTFANSPTLQRRLANGEWVMAELGESVAENFDEHVHVSTTELTPRSQFYLAIGWDGGFSPSAVIAQNVGGQVRVFAALNGLRIGVLELIQQQVLPWLQSHAGWALANYGARLMHVIDPNLSTPGQASIMESAEKVILERLGGQVIKGAVRWPPRREAVLKVLAPTHVAGRPMLQIAPGEETRLLVEALSGRWFYPTLPNGQVDRSGPRKPNSPYSDIGDAFAYVVGWLTGGEVMEIQTRPLTVESRFTFDLYGNVVPLN